MTWETDNRWSPNGSGMVPPDDAPAVYSARWIDHGETSMADVVPDRQGFAYWDTEERELLIAKMRGFGNDLRIPGKIGLTERDICTTIVDSDWKCYMRRCGGYIYVDAWLVPTNEDDEITTEHHPACDDDGWDHPGPCHLEAYDRVVVTEVPDRTWEVRCEDGSVRHNQNFWTLAEAREFANHGHACTNTHLFVEVWS